MKCVQNRSDFSKVIQCVQGNKESLPAFIQQFIQVWETNAGIKQEDNELFAIQTFLRNLKPHGTTAYKHVVADWQEISWKTTISKLMSIYTNQLFSTNDAGSKPMMQHVNNESKNQYGGRQNPKKKRGNCNNCSKSGN